MPDEVSPEAIRADIDQLRNSPEVKDLWHPSHDRALQTLSEMYAKLHPEPEETEPPSETPTEPKAETPNETPTTTEFEGVPAEEVQGLDGLKAEWGSEFNTRLQQAQGLAAEFTRTYGDEFVGWLETSRAGSNPLIIKAFSAWAAGEPGPEVTPSEARELVKVLRSGEYYGRADSKMHDVLHNVISKLYELGYAEGDADALR